MSSEFNKLRDQVAALQQQVSALQGAGNMAQRESIAGMAVNEEHLNAVPGTAGQVLSSDGAGTIEWATVPGGIIAADSILGSHLSPDVAGDGLIQDASGNLDIQVDGTTIQIVTDTLSVVQGGIDHDQIANVSTDDHHTEAHTLASHSDQVADDHGAAATDQIVNVCYGTGAPPAANTTTEGALFIQYTA